MNASSLRLYSVVIVVPNGTRYKLEYDNPYPVVFCFMRFVYDLFLHYVSQLKGNTQIFGPKAMKLLKGLIEVTGNALKLIKSI